MFYFFFFLFALPAGSGSGNQLQVAAANALLLLQVDGPTAAVAEWNERRMSAAHDAGVERVCREPQSGSYNCKLARGMPSYSLLVDGLSATAADWIERRVSAAHDAGAVRVATASCHCERFAAMCMLMVCCLR